MQSKKTLKKKAVTIKGIDPEEYKRFKIACEENDITIRQAILWFIKQGGEGTIFLCMNTSKTSPHSPS